MLFFFTFSCSFLQGSIRSQCHSMLANYALFRRLFYHVCPVFRGDLFQARLFLFLQRGRLCQTCGCTMGIVFRVFATYSAPCVSNTPRDLLTALPSCFLSKINTLCSLHRRLRSSLELNMPEKYFF